MTEFGTKLEALYRTLIDSRNGYDEAFKDAGGEGLFELFRDMMVLHGQNAEAIGSYVRSAGGEADGGSLMTAVNRTIMKVRSVFGGLDTSVLPGLIDGDERVLAIYDETLAACPSVAPEREVLMRQRAELAGKVEAMKRQLAAAKTAS